MKFNNDLIWLRAGEKVTGYQSISPEPAGSLNRPLKQLLDNDLFIYQKLADIQTTILNSDDALVTHEADINNSHQVNATDIGLGNLPNAISDVYNVANSNSLASGKALYDVWQLILDYQHPQAELDTIVSPDKGTVILATGEILKGNGYNGNSVVTPKAVWDTILRSPKVGEHGYNTQWGGGVSDLYTIEGFSYMFDGIATNVGKVTYSTPKSYNTIVVDLAAIPWLRSYWDAKDTSQFFYNISIVPWDSDDQQDTIPSMIYVLLDGNANIRQKGNQFGTTLGYYNSLTYPAGNPSRPSDFHKGFYFVTNGPTSDYSGRVYGGTN